MSDFTETQFTVGDNYYVQRSIEEVNEEMKNYLNLVNLILFLKEHSLDEEHSSKIIELIEEFYESFSDKLGVLHDSIYDALLVHED